MKEAEKDIEKYIKKQIKKSGFPLEIKSSIILRKFGCNTELHTMYYNELRQRDSEIDIFAFKKNKAGDRAIGLTFDALVIECKKQEKEPWVFFEQDNPNTMVTTICARPKRVYTWLEENFEHHYYYGQKPCQFHFPAFVKSGNPEVIAEAINQVLDGLKFIYEQELQAHAIYWLYYPVIILDGRLFSAKVEASGNVKVTETKYLQLSVVKGLRKPEEIKIRDTESVLMHTKNFVVDIVRIDFLEEFLKNFP
jgi:hypothetical protein